MPRPRIAYRYIVWLMLSLSVHTGYAQFFFLPEGQSRQKVPFELVHNLIIIPVSINGEGPYHFILDS